MSEIQSRLQAALAGRYDIERELGEGGMATVYLAQDLKHHRPVALKVLRPELAAILGAERFLKEIELTANLQHPNILPLYDSGEADSFLYYVMPFVEGESLRDRLRREHQLGVDDAVEITKAVAAALQYAHERKVVHRDIKPENILLQSGQALVADFGIALAVSQAGGTRLTQTGLSLGTPAYMSPEQATGDRELDVRSDIYSLGCVTYEMLVGEPPHVGNSVQAIIAKILSERPAPVSQTRDMVPPNVDAAVQKALARSPADRFRSAAEFASALTNSTFTLPAATSGPVVTGKRSHRRERAAVPLAVATVLLLAAAIWGWLRPAPGASSQVVQLPITLPDSAPLQQQFGILFALSDDGSNIVYVGPGQGDIDLWERPLDKLTATRIPGTNGGDSPFLSPGGETVAFYRNTPNAVFTVSLRGGPRRTLVSDSMVALGGDWGPDGSIYFVRARGIRRLQPDGTVEEVTHVDSASGDVSHGWVDVLPNGRGAVFTILRAAEEQYDIAVVDLRSHAVKILTRGTYARYSPAGYLLYATADGGLFAVGFDEKSLTTHGTVIPVAANVAHTGRGLTHFAVSANGTLLYGAGGAGGSQELVWVDRKGQTQPVDTALGGPFADVALSPDGQRLAFDQQDASGWQVWTKDLRSGTISKLTVTGELNYSPFWSPDGKTVLYVAGGNSMAALYERRADGSAPARLLLQASRPIQQASMSNDGEWIIYQTDDAGAPTGRDLFARRVTGDTATVTLVASPANDLTPRLSPDGRWLAYVSLETQSPEVYVSPFPNTSASRVQVSLSGGVEPLWSRNGRELFYMAQSNELMAARLETAGGVRVVDQTALFDRSQYNISAPDAPEYDVTPDGQRFIMSRPLTRSSEQLVMVLNFFEELRAAGGR
jgi:serine/threonine protein kinase